MVCLQPRTGKKGSGRPRAPGERSQAQPSRLPAAHHTSTAASWGSGSPCPQHPPGAPSLTARSQTQAPSAAPPPAGLGQGDWGKQRCHLPVQEARVPLSPPPSAHKAPFQAMEHTQERRPAAWGLRAKKCLPHWTCDLINTCCFLPCWYKQVPLSLSNCCVLFIT